MAAMTKSRPLRSSDQGPMVELPVPKQPQSESIPKIQARAMATEKTISMPATTSAAAWRQAEGAKTKTKLAITSIEGTLTATQGASSARSW